MDRPMKHIETYWNIGISWDFMGFFPGTMDVPVPFRGHTSVACGSHGPIFSFEGRTLKCAAWCSQISQTSHVTWCLFDVTSPILLIKLIKSCVSLPEGKHFQKGFVSHTHDDFCQECLPECLDSVLGFGLRHWSWLQERLKKMYVRVYVYMFTYNYCIHI